MVLQCSVLDPSGRLQAESLHEVLTMHGSCSANSSGGKKMKKVISAISALCLLMAFTLVANAAEKGGDPQKGKNPGVVKAQAAIPGQNDQRLITPDMNRLERYETMRLLKKRAAAKRNSLMLHAAEQRKAQKQAGSPGQLPVE